MEISNPVGPSTQLRNEFRAPVESFRVGRLDPLHTRSGATSRRLLRTKINGGLSKSRLMSGGMIKVAGNLAKPKTGWQFVLPTLLNYFAVAINRTSSTFRPDILTTNEKAITPDNFSDGVH